MNEKDYESYVKQVTPTTSLCKNMLLAFIVGGLICTFGQFLINVFMNWGLDKETAINYETLLLIFLAILLTGLNVFQKIAKHAGAGTLVPITGFSNAVVSPAMEFKSEGYVLGMAAKMFTIAGPVIVCGVLASAIYGVVLMLLGQ